MKLELLDAYSIRARLSASIILLAPFAITLFLCFEEVASFASSSVIIFILLAFTNYVPILQRRIYQKNLPFIDYASQYLLINDGTIDSASKHRFYMKLAALDESFSKFLAPDDSDEFSDCCKSAVRYIRNHTRENTLVQEENINFGFCRNLWANKTAGIILCIVFAAITGVYSYAHFGTLPAIPIQNYIAFAANIALLLFWIFGVTEEVLTSTAKAYAKTLIYAIDSLN